MSGAEKELALLLAIAESEPSQRGLSRRAGLSLGGTNELLRRLMREGCVRAVARDRRSARYELTPLGRSEGRRRALAAAGRALDIARALGPGNVGSLS